jgi:hypothetical protein
VSPFLLVMMVVFLLMGLKLTDIYVGGHYVCPSCGSEKRTPPLERLSLEPAALRVKGRLRRNC